MFSLYLQNYLAYINDSLGKAVRNPLFCLSAGYSTKARSLLQLAIVEPLWETI